MSEVRYPLTRPSFIQCLRNARTLIAERGWVPDGPTAAPPSSGPLTLTGSLWAGARWGEDGKLVDPGAAGAACHILCVALWGQQAEDASFSFVALGQWARLEGRTQEDVLGLFDRAAVAYVKAIEKFCADVDVLAGDDLPCPQCGTLTTALCARDGACRHCKKAVAR